MVVAADKQLHRLLALTAGAGLAAGAAAGGLEFAHRHPLEVAVLGEQHHRALVGDQVDVVEAAFEIEDLGATRRVVAAADRLQLLGDQSKHPIAAGQDVLVIGDLGEQILVLQPDLVRLEGGEAPQLHLQDGIGLHLAQPELIHQALAGRGGVRGGADQGNDRVEVVEGDQQAEQDVVPLLGLAQQIAGAPLDRLNPEVEEDLEQLAQGEQDRLALHQRQHVGVEVALQRCELEEVVEHHLGVGIAPQLDHDPHAVAVALVADVGDALELLVVDQLGDALDQSRLVGLVRKFGDDHRVAVGPALGLDRFDVGHAPHRHRAPAGGVGLADAAAAEDLAAGGEVGTGDDRHQGPVVELGVGDQGQQAIDQFSEVMGGDVGGHPHGDAGGAVEQQLRNPRRHHRGLLLGAIEVVDEVDRFALDVLQQGIGGERLQPGFGVAHRGRWVVVDRTEVAVPIDQGQAHREVLGHAHQGVVNRRIAMGVVFAEHLAHHTGAFAVGAVVGEPQLIHGVENAPVHRLEAIAGVGQGPAHDHAHRILHIGARHLITEVGLDDPSVCITGT